jgi:transposase-like protein
VKKASSSGQFTSNCNASAWQQVPEEDAMGRDSKTRMREEEVRGFGLDTIEQVMRERVRATIEAIVEEELEAALGARRSARVGEQRQGYRHGRRERQLTTSLGVTTLQVPRARLAQPGGETTEWRSQVLPRYQRRTARVDEAILGVYLSGTNSRRLKGALAPLLRGGPLSKDAVSRLVGRLKSDFEEWCQRDLSQEAIRYIMLDGWYPKVRIGRRRVRVPVLVTLGIKADGQRIVLDLRLAGQETTQAWQEVIEKLVARRVGVPLLAIIDGNPGLHAALRAQWPQMPIQRCTAHKLRNLLSRAPVHLREEIAEDYRRMIYGANRDMVESARRSFLKKWRLRCAVVAASLEEAGDELFTFLSFPPSQWKGLRTTNALERINEEFRRRTKTQASLPNEDAVLLLLFGLLRTNQIRLRRFDGWKQMPAAAPLLERRAA